MTEFRWRRSAPTEIHTHLCSWRVIACTMLAVGLVLLLVDAVWHPWIIFGPVVDLALAIGSGTIVARLTTIELSPETVRTGGGTCKWQDAELVSTRFGEVLRTKRGTRADRIGVLLGLYGPAWREGPLGDDVRSWAPWLLSGHG